VFVEIKVVAVAVALLLQCQSKLEPNLIYNRKKNDIHSFGANTCKSCMCECAWCVWCVWVCILKCSSV